MSQYEVWCHACNVTFPPGAKRCLHCGARTRPDPPPAARRRAESAGGPLAGLPLSYSYENGPVMVASEVPVAGATTEPDEEPARRSILRAGMTILWMILLAAGYAWRACSQESP